MSMLEDVKKVFQELIVPELQQIKTDGQVIKVRMESLDARLVSLEREMNGRFDAVNERIEGVHKQLNSLEREMNGRFDAVAQRFDAVDQRLHALQRDMDSALDIRERLGAIEAKLAAR